MSIQTRSPRGGWSAVRAVTDYSSVVSNYAGAIQQAQNQADNTEIETKVFDYQQGLLSYEGLTEFLNEKLASVSSNSQKELDVREIIAKAGDYERNKNNSIQRSKLEAKFAKDGVGAGERVRIEEALLANYKQGTPEYAEQLNVIAAARELENQENKNTELARLSAELAEGGLNTAEELEILEKARDLTENGSSDRAQIDQAINLKKDDLEKEVKQEQMNLRLSDMLDEFTPGGLDNNELLSMNLEMQTFFEKGTPEYIELKQGEADIRGELAKTAAGSGRLAAARKNQAESVLAEIEAQRSELQRAFKAGEITDTQLSQAEQALLGASKEIFDSLGDGVFSDESLSKDLGELNVAIQSNDAQLEQLQSGNLLTVLNKAGEQVTVGNDERFLGKFSVDSDISILDDDGNLSLEADDTGAAIKKPVITVTSGGQQFKAVVNPGGQLEVLSERQGADGLVTFVRTGTIFDQAFQRRALGGDASGQPGDFVDTEGQEPSSTAQGPSFEQTDQPVFGPQNKPVFGPQNKPSSPEKSGEVLGTGDFKPSGLSLPKFDFKPKKVESTFGAGGLFGAAKNKVSSFISEKSTPGKIEGTRDFGVTEAVGSAFEKAKSFISNLFGK